MVIPALCGSMFFSLSHRPTISRLWGRAAGADPFIDSTQILSKEPQWFVAAGLPKPGKRKQDLGCPTHFMVKCHLVTLGTQHSDTKSHNYAGLFLLPDFQILTPMFHIIENAKVLISPVPKISALKMKPWYSLTDTEPKQPSPASGDRFISAVCIGS